MRPWSQDGGSTKSGFPRFKEEQSDSEKESGLPVRCTQTGLVAFDGKVIMGLPACAQRAGKSSNDVIADVALGQQGVGGDGFALDGNGVKQGDGDFDFVGAFGFVAAGDWQ